MRTTMRRAARLAGAFLLLVAALQATPEETRLPVPEPSARAPVVAELKKELGDKLKARDPEAKRTLARALLDRAKSMMDAKDADAVKQYVLFEQAAALAEEARDVGLALVVVTWLSQAFQVEYAARCFTAVDAITRGAKDTVVLVEGATLCLELTGGAFMADDANTAGKASSTAKALAKSAKLGGLVARASEIADLVPVYKRLAVAAEVARTTLAATPDDAAAHEALGRFWCFGRGVWELGLPHLAKSVAPALADVAGKDAANPADAGARQALADAWWDLAQKEKEPLARARMLGRAASIYESPGTATSAQARGRLDSLTWRAWADGVAFTKDFSKDGPVSLALSIVREYIAAQHIDKHADNWKTKLPKFPEVPFARGEQYLWRLDTNQGVIVIRFFPDTAPKHVANFLYLTELGFFDGSNFHRVIPGFMAQGGSSNPSGNGGPGYSFATEFIGDRKHDKAGVLSMANTGEPNTDASQFFITFAAAPHLDGKHTIFGEVVEGLDVVKKLEAQGTSDELKQKTPLVINIAKVSMR